MAQAVEGAAFDEALHHTLVDLAQIHAGTKVHQRSERPFGLSFRHDGLDGPLAHILDRHQTVADLAVADLEGRPAVVHVRRQNFDTMAAAFDHVLDDPVGGMHFARQQGRQEFHRVVRFEIGGLIGNQSIGGAVGLVEPVAPEFFHEVENRFGFIFGNLVFQRPGHERIPMLGHFLGDFLAHGLAQVVRFGHGIIGQFGGNFHDLLLVEDNAVGLLENRLEFRHKIDHGLAAVFALNKIIHHAAVQGAGAIEGHQGGDVGKRSRLQPHQQIFHAGAFQLENARGVAAGQEGIGRPVVQIQIDHIGHRLTLIRQKRQGLFDDREVAQSQEIELDEPRLFHVLHVKLGYHLPFFTAVQGQVFHQGLVADDHAGGVGGGVAREALQDTANLEQFRNFRARGGQLVEFRLLGDGILETDVENIRHHFGNGIHLPQGNVQRSPYIPDHGPCLEFSIGNDLRYKFSTAVLLHHVFVDLVPPVDAEIHVDVGHADAGGVQEPFKNQAVLDGVQIGNAHGVGHHAAGRRPAPRAHRNAVFLGVADEVGHDEEIGGKTHFLDDGNFIFQPLIVDRLVNTRLFLPDFVHAAPVAGTHRSLEQVFRADIFGRGKGWKMIGEIELIGAPAGNGERIFDGAGVILKGGLHFRRGLEVELVRAEPEAVALVDGFAGLDAQQHIVGPHVLLFQVMAVVAGHQGDGQFGAHLPQGAVHRLLDVDPVVLDLEIEMVVAKEFLVPAGGGFGLLDAPLLDMHGDFAVQAGRQGDKAAMMRGQ